MKISLILGHPKKGSFNHAIAGAALRTLTDRGHAVTYHDLYGESFEPALPESEIPKDVVLLPCIKDHCEEIVNAEGIIIVHPNWWGQPPAIVKGWIDRVIRPGLAYEFREDDTGEGVPVGLLKAKAALVFNTSNTRPDREQEVFGDPLETIWRNCIFGLCGITNVHRATFGVMVTSSERQREAWLQEVRETVNRYFP